MSGRQPRPYDSLARRWLALAQRRETDFIALVNSGRWRHYFTEGELAEEKARIALVRDRWAEVVGLSPTAPEPKPEELSSGGRGVEAGFTRGHSQA